MKKLMLLAAIISLSTTAFAVEMKTMVQDNSVVKYNLKNSAKPGICSELANALMKTGDIKISGLTSAAPLPRIESALEAGDIDVFLCLLKSDERAKKFNYIDVPLYQVNHVLVSMASDKTDVKSLDELKEISKKETVMVPQGSSLVKFLEEKGVTVDTSTKDELSSVKKLQAGRGKFIYAQDLSIISTLRDAGIDKSQMRFLPVTFKSEAQYVAYSKKMNADGVAKLKAAVEKLKASGELDKIVNSYK